MRVIAKSTLKAFWEKHPDAEIPLKTWFKIVENSDWKSTSEIKRLFGDASVISSSRMVFNIKGNKYRVVVYIVFQINKVFIRFVGTHSEYDKIDVKNI